MMNSKECEVLETVLKQHQIPERYYSIGKSQKGRICIEHTADKWIVYTGKEKRKYKRMTFDSFYEACCYMFEEIITLQKINRTRYGVTLLSDMRGDLKEQLRAHDTEYSEAQDSWEQIEKAFDEAYHMSTKPGNEFIKFKEDAIIDEDMSVRWNKEEVERRNKAYEEERQKLIKKADDAKLAAYDRAVKLVAHETGIPEEKAKILWSFVYGKYHASGRDLFTNIEEYIDLINSIIN